MSSSLSKRTRNNRTQIDRTKQYPLTEAISQLKKCSESIKFIETVDVAFNLGIDAKKSDQMVRGSTLLPNGTGRNVRVAVFAQGQLAEDAISAGADIVGFEDLAEKIKAGMLEFDVVIATPDSMRIVGQLGQILGPRGLMPNPKVGTVTQDVATAVKNSKGGQVRYRTDKAGILHSIIGKVNFTAEQLAENLQAIIADLKKAKPASSKGVYLKKITLSTTMGPGLVVDQSTI